MSARRQGGNRQPDLFPRSKRPAISLPNNHPMVVLTDTVDWTEMELQAEKVRAKKLKLMANVLRVEDDTSHAEGCRFNPCNAKRSAITVS
jgi:hypothetical protein